MISVNDIWKKQLPKFGYVIEKDNGRDFVVILGTGAVMNLGKYPFEDKIYLINDKMQTIYSQEKLSDNDKIQLTKLFIEMQSFCEPQGDKEFATIQEQETFVNGLTENEKKQIEKQIQMIIDCGNFYYIFADKLRYQGVKNNGTY